jgi:hypothetical protein
MATSNNVYESTPSASSGQADGVTTFNDFDSVNSDNPGTNVPATTYTATGLTAGTPLLEVTAANASGESSDTSPAGIAIPTGVTSVTATPSADGSSATVAWTPDTSALGYLIFRTPDDGSSAAELAGTVSGGSSASYTDGTTDSSDSYTYSVDPYYSDPAPTTQTGDGTGSGSSADDLTGKISDFNATVSGTTVHFTWSYQGGTTGLELEEEDQSDPGANYAWIQSPTDRTASVTGLNPGDQGTRSGSTPDIGHLPHFGNSSQFWPPKTKS